jgi:lipopolysaccharide export system protein LptA
MRNKQAARYARWSAAIAFVVALSVAGMYSRRTRLGTETKDTTPPVPPTVQQQTAQFFYSKVKGDRTVYTVRASRATDFKEGSRSLLEDVWLTSYGSLGLRADNLHSEACDYVSDKGQFVCSGPVQIDLASTNEARDGRVVHIGTSGVSFDSQAGIASSDEPVDFNLPQAQGKAVGARYESQKGDVVLLQDVHLSLRGGGSTGAPAAILGSGEMDISGSRLEYDRDARMIDLLGPVMAKQGASTLRAGRLEIQLDENLRTRRIVALGGSSSGDAGGGSGRPELSGLRAGTMVSISADEISSRVSPDGWTEEVVATGKVQATRPTAAGQERLEGSRLDVAMAPGTNQAKRMTVSDNVAVTSELPGGIVRRINTSSLVMDFAMDGPNGSTRPQTVSTPAATIDWQGPEQLSAGRRGSTTPAAAMQETHVTGQEFQGSFDGQGELRELHGGGGVEVERKAGNAPIVTSTSRELVAEFAPNGVWSTVKQTGDLRLREEDKTGEAPEATADQAGGVVTFAGPFTLTDASSRTVAQSGTFTQATREFRAAGAVVTSELQATRTAAASAQTPGHLSSDRVVSDTGSGYAIYSGHARLWQGDSVIEADTVELDRTSQTMTATGKVRAVFPQANSPQGGPKTTAQDTGQPGVVHAEAGRMVYRDGEHRARLEESPAIRNAEGIMRATSIDLFFQPQVTQPAPLPGAPVSPLGALEGQTLQRATAQGAVSIDSADRHARGGHADYTAADGKFVLSGDNPIIFDGSGNKTAGRQLTFVFSDDTIVVDSEEGKRTLTLHRVEK